LRPSAFLGRLRGAGVRLYFRALVWARAGLSIGVTLPSGARKDDMMSLVARALKDQDIDDLAAYYSAIEVSVGPPPK
jgi:hypothetical protein